MKADSSGLTRTEKRERFDSLGATQGKRPYRGRGIDTALELPPPGAMRWGPRSKAAVVIAIRQGRLTLEEACVRYALSISEYLTWESGLDTGGLNGLALAGRQQCRRGIARPRK